MDLHLSKEHEMLRKMYRDFAENEVKPLAEWVDENEAFPEETVKKMAKLGMMGIYFPKEYGGAGADVLSYVMAVEEMSELQKALLKYLRFKDHEQGDEAEILAAISEERADVEIMLNQLHVIFGDNTDMEIAKLEHLCELLGE